VFHVVLVNPEIPPNTGNVIRLCANTGAELHLMNPWASPCRKPSCAAPGMDYTELASVTVHPDWAACRAELAKPGCLR
jgi:tRNA (cytidine/uridine-2'-O-)-methyltransferase